MEPTLYLLLALLVVFLITFIVSLYKVLFNYNAANLCGKHVVITGGSSGIGKSVAVAAAKRGANVTIIARNCDKLEDARRTILSAIPKNQSQMIKMIVCDVTQSYEKTESQFTDLEAEVGPIFMLVNCAGSAECAKIEDATESNFRQMINLNLMGTILPTKAVLKSMTARKEGIIVITASQAALLGIFGLSAYCASKWGLRGFAESLQQEVAPHNLSVTLCLPPDTDTPGFENENKNKPVETMEICQGSGLYSPDVVGQKLLSDALEKRFWSTVGLEGNLLIFGCAGFSPLSSFYEVFLQISFASIVRIISIFHLRNVDKIISSGNIKQTKQD